MKRGLVSLWIGVLLAVLLAGCGTAGGTVTGDEAAEEQLANGALQQAVEQALAMNLPTEAAATTVQTETTATVQTGAATATQTFAAQGVPSATSAATVLAASAKTATVRATLPTLPTLRTLRTNSSTRTMPNAPSSGTGRTPWEVSVSSVSTPLEGAKVLRAWKASQSGVQVEAHRLQWGPKKAVTSRWGYTAEVQPVITVAKIAADPSHLHFRDAQQILNTDVKTIEAMAKEEGALIAFNGVYFSSHTPPSYYTIGAPVVRDGVVVSQANDSAEWSLLGWNDGRWSREYISGATVQQQLGNGLRFSISDHHVPVEGGQVVYTWPEDGVQPYSMFGQIDASHYVIAIGEYAHRSDVAAACVAYGAQTVVELNGGNCAYLYLKGVGNAPNPGATTNTLKQLNKLNLLFNEEMAMLGIFGGKGMGGPDQSIDMIYFK